MTVLNKAATADFISNWIKEQANEAGATNGVFGCSGGVDSALVAVLTKKVFPNCVAVFLPCHSSGSSLVRAQELCSKFKIQSIVVDLSSCHDTISKVVEEQLNRDNVSFEHSNGTEGALRSCLRAPTLDYVAKKLNALIIGTGNRDEDEFTRYYQKRGDGCVDISPIAKLHKSEVYELASFLGVPESILKATPTADLWGPDSGQADEVQLGLTYQEVEWGIREIDRHDAFQAIDSVQNIPHLGEQGAFQNYDGRQAKIISTLLKMEVTSRHKANPWLPVCDVRSVPGLVR